MWPKPGVPVTAAPSLGLWAPENGDFGIWNAIHFGLLNCFWVFRRLSRFNQMNNCIFESPWTGFSQYALVEFVQSEAILMNKSNRLETQAFDFKWL